MTQATATIIDGKKTASDLRAQLAKQIATLPRPPALAVIVVGDNPASKVYVGNKERACSEVGIQSQTHRLPNNTELSSLLALIDTLNNDDKVDGILVQLPLPQGLDSNTVINHISAKKDVDGFHPFNFGHLAQGTPTLRPCTPYGVMKLLQTYNIPIEGQDVVVIGKSNIVGRPMAFELLTENATVTVCHKATKDLPAKLKNADILVVGIGDPKFIKGEWLKPGVVIIDVGINRLPDGTLCGDVDFASASAIASAITPVPGGVGPMTVAMLLQNTLTAYHMRHAQ